MVFEKFVVPRIQFSYFTSSFGKGHPPYRINKGHAKHITDT